MTEPNEPTKLTQEQLTEAKLQIIIDSFMALPQAEKEAIIKRVIEHYANKFAEELKTGLSAMTKELQKAEAEAAKEQEQAKVEEPQKMEAVKARPPVASKAKRRRKALEPN